MIVKQRAGQRPRRRWTVPNLLSLFRLGLVPVFVLSALGGKFGLAFAIFLTAAVTDALDGWIARRYDQRSSLGAILDPAADKTLMISGYVVMTMEGIAPLRLPVWLTFTVFARDLILVFFAYLLYTRLRARRFPPSIIGKVSTIIQVIALAATLAANSVLEPLFAPLLFAIYAITFTVTLYSGWDYLRRWNAVVLSSG